MFFFKNVFLLFYVGFRKNNFLKISFKKRYKLYMFFKKNEVYFSKFFNVLKLKGLTPFFYVAFIQFFLKKNFDNNSFRSVFPWVSDENLFFCTTYFLNKIFRVRVQKKFKSSKNTDKFWDNIKKNFKSNNKLKNYWVFNFAKTKLTSNSKTDVQVNNSNYVVNYSGTSLGKYINDSSLNNMSVYFLRKNRMFNKGRYSRNRQNYRTGVYWCLYINIMVLFGLHFYFYRFTFNFGYMWWLLFSLIASFFVPRALKFRLYNPRVFLQVFLQSQPLIFYLFDRKFFKGIVSKFKF